MAQQTDSSAPIRITEADAKDTHVDDLLRRQANLRGDTGISRDRGGKWYYRSWFVLMLAGLAAAFIGWAVIEPFFYDMPYIEGEIKQLDLHPGAGAGEPVGEMTIGDMKYLVVHRTKEWSGTAKKWVPLDVDKLHQAERVGVFAAIPDGARADPGTLEPVAAFIKEDVPPSAVGDDLLASNRKQNMVGILLFPFVAGCVGLFIGAADGVMCRLPRRIFLAGGIGLVVGLVGGLISVFLAGSIYMPIREWASHQVGNGPFGLSTTGFLAQVGGRALAWTIAGMAMGLGQGLALRSGRVLLYGFLGGLLGGLFGGMLFDPINLLVSGEGNPSAWSSRMISLSVIGLSVGLMIGIVELLARDAWLRMVAGPLAGKEFLIFKSNMNVGASPRSDIYLFNDEAVAPLHAIIRATGDAYEIEGASDVYPLLVNGRATQRSRLRHGDQIGLGRTTFVFQRKRG